MIRERKIVKKRELEKERMTRESNTVKIVKERERERERER